MRFHGFGRTERPAREYAEADGETRVALIGRHGERIVAAAGYDRLREPGVAEVAFTVADDFQGRGTATRMLEQLAAVAAERGIERFDAEVLADNRPMLKVFRRAGFDVRRTGMGGEVVLSLDIRPTEEVRERIAARDHRAAVASLRPILSPASVAVVGASSEPGSVGGALLANIMEAGFQGVASPVNRSGGVVRSVRVARDLGELPEVPELVVVAVPAAEVLDVARGAVDHGARALLVVLTGFRDAGEEARARQEELLEVVRSAGVRMVGPNSLGVLNTDPAVSLNATVAGARVPSGRLAISSQSGAIGIGLLGHAAARSLGVSSFAALGARADVSTNDLLEYWEDDDRTAAVMLYVETFGNPERFARICRRVSQRKPILALKGRGAAAPAGGASSHTAAAMRGDAVVDALLRHAGVLRFHSGDQLFDAAQFFEAQPLPVGRRMAVVTNSTGVGALAADACAARGLAVGRPAATGLANPLSLGIHAAPEDYGRALSALLADEAVDAVMAFYVDLSGGDPRGVLAAISDAAARHHKPVAASVVEADGRLPESRSDAVPNFLFPDACSNVLARAVQRREWLSRPLGQRRQFGDVDADAARALVAAWLGGDGDGDGSGPPEGRWLTTDEAEAILATHGIPYVPGRRCPDADTAVTAAGEIGGPLALKADFPPPAQAGDLDAVLLGLEGDDAVRAGWRELERRVRAAGREWLGAVVQPLAGGGADVLVGAVRDAELGPVMATGMGGRHAGLAPDVAFRLLPVTDVDADELIDAARSVAAQLEGFRGSAPLDRQALRDVILRFALLLREVPELVEGDLNPVRCLPDGAVVIDMRLRIARRRRMGSVKTW